MLFAVPPASPREGRMKIKNKANGVEAEVPDTLAELLVKTGSWEPAEAAEPVKPARKRAARKPAAVVEEPVSDEE